MIANSLNINAIVVVSPGTTYRVTVAINRATVRPKKYSITFTGLFFIIHAVFCLEMGGVNVGGPKAFRWNRIGIIAVKRLSVIGVISCLGGRI